jgi:beta-xylosidase
MASAPVWLLTMGFVWPAWAANSPVAKPIRPDGTYLNPVGDPPLLLGDPFVLVHSKKYYLFGTASPSEGFQCYESPDLVHWHLDGWAWRKSAMRVAMGDLHSPQVFEYQGMFCMTYSAWTARGNQLALAASTRPEGPYHDLHVPWLGLDSCSSGSVFIDNNRKAFLIYCRKTSAPGRLSSSIYGVALSKDLSGTVGQPVELLQTSQRWEMVQRDRFRLNDSPHLFRTGSRYYLIYSANDPATSERAVGYATALKPLGPWTKSLENPLISSQPSINVTAPDHCSVFRSLNRGEWFVVYQTFAQSNDATSPHVVNIDRLTMGPEYKLRLNGPTRSPQPLPQAQ